MNRTVFISSTFEDLKEARKLVWNILTKYDVNVRGMERFGARKAAPLTTCLSEVEQSDIFVGIISFRLGTIDKKTKKSFVQLEYEKALDLEKEIFIYLIDEKDGIVSPKHIDFDEKHEKLVAFKSILKERHTIDTFKSPEDLGEKLKRKFDDLLKKKKTIDEEESINEFTRTKDLLKKFLLLPYAYSDKEVRLRVKLDGEPFPASKAICESFYLSYGYTIGVKINIVKPEFNQDDFRYLLITHKQAEEFFNIDMNSELDIYATVRFSKDTVESIKAHFVTRTYITLPSDVYATSLGSQNSLLGKKVTEQAEGQIILQLKEFAKKEKGKTLQPTIAK